MTGKTPGREGDVEDPLEAVFEHAVQPYANGAALQASLPTEAPVIILRKRDGMPTETRTLAAGGTLKVPVLDALKNSKLAEWHRVGAYDFDALERDEIGLLFLERSQGEPELKVVTRGRDTVLLVADLASMLEALALVANTPAFRALPGAEFLVQALSSGIESAKNELLHALATPDASGRSLIERFRKAAESGNASLAQTPPSGG